MDREQGVGLKENASLAHCASTLLEMVMENLDFYLKFTKNQLCSFVDSIGKKSHKCVGNFYH
jgi:hypothetical protein